MRKVVGSLIGCAVLLSLWGIWGGTRASAQVCDNAEITLSSMQQLQGTLMPCRLGRDVPWLPAEIAVFSDHPETLKTPGLLFHGGLLPLRAVRLQLYHLNGLKEQPLYLVLRVRNLGGQTAQIGLVQALGTPSGDYFAAGHSNNLLFLQSLLQGAGQQLTLPANSEYKIFTQKVPAGTVLSGTVQWCLLCGDNVEYALYACNSPDEDGYGYLLANPQDVHARGIYSAPQRHRCQTVDITSWLKGDEGLYWAIGATRQPSSFIGPELKGDYGVLYSWDLTLVNDGEKQKQLEFALNPRGGPATATFAVVGDDGQQIWEITSPVKPFEFGKLAQITVPAHSHKHYRIFTLPEGASNYPVRLTVRPKADDSLGEVIQ